MANESSFVKDYLSITHKLKMFFSLSLDELEKNVNEFSSMYIVKSIDIKLMPSKTSEKLVDTQKWVAFVLYAEKI